MPRTRLWIVLAVLLATLIGAVVAAWQRGVLFSATRSFTSALQSQ
jgi:hypothetical protein